MKKETLIVPIVSLETMVQTCPNSKYIDLKQSQPQPIESTLFLNLISGRDLMSFSIKKLEAISRSFGNYKQAGFWELVSLAIFLRSSSGIATNITNITNITALKAKWTTPYGRQWLLYIENGNSLKYHWVENHEKPEAEWIVFLNNEN